METRMSISLQSARIEEFCTLTEAQILTEQWRIGYNMIRPHSALAGLTADEYAKKRDSSHHHNRWTTNRGLLKRHGDRR